MHSTAPSLVLAVATGCCSLYVGWSPRCTGDINSVSSSTCATKLAAPKQLRVHGDQLTHNVGVHRTWHGINGCCHLMFESRRVTWWAWHDAARHGEAVRCSHLPTFWPAAHVCHMLIY
jgi:hypothetical protein